MMSQQIDSLLRLETSCWMLRFGRRIDTETPDETAVMRDTNRAPQSISIIKLDFPALQGLGSGEVIWKGSHTAILVRTLTF